MKHRLSDLPKVTKLVLGTEPRSPNHVVSVLNEERYYKFYIRSVPFFLPSHFYKAIYKKDVDTSTAFRESQLKCRRW